MTTELKIQCQPRPEGSKPNALRRSGLVPAVLYGHNGTESVALTVAAKDAELLIRDAALNSSLIEVQVPELPWSGKALLREVQAHPWKKGLYHLSFFSVASHGSIDVDIPLHFVGEAAGVKLNGGILDTVITQLHVRCAPDSIPDVIEVDVSSLNVGDALHVNEIPLPTGASVLGDASQVVVSVLSSGGGQGESA